MLSVSVAMATYNGEKYLRRQLDSVAAQSYVPTELVVVDDGSHDETLSIAREFAKNASFSVHVKRNVTRLGYRENFMRAANLCTSDVIAFCDQDDIWHPNKLAACVEQFGEPEVLLVYHNADIVTADGTLIRSLNEFALSGRLSSGPTAFSLGFTQVFRQSMLRFSNLWSMSCDHIVPSEPMAHDQWFFFLASVLGRIVYLDKTLVGYVQHDSNTCGWPIHEDPLLNIKGFLRNQGQQYSQLSKSFQCRASVLDSAITELDGTWKNRALMASNNYRRLSEIYAKRSEIYLSTKFSKRLKAFRELVAKGGYDGGSFGRKSLVKDIFFGVPVGSSLKIQLTAEANKSR